MAKRQVPVPEPEGTMEPDIQPTDEEQAQWEEETRRAHEESLAPYQAVHRQQNEQDDLLAELLFKDTMRDLMD